MLQLDLCTYEGMCRVCGETKTDIWVEERSSHPIFWICTSCADKKYPGSILDHQRLELKKSELEIAGSELKNAIEHYLKELSRNGSNAGVSHWTAQLSVLKGEKIIRNINAKKKT